MFDFYDASRCFQNVEIKGGICYFLRDKNYNDKCEIKTFIDKEIIKSKRYLKEDDDDIYIRDSRLIEIKKKCVSEKSFDTIVSSMKPYGIRGDLFKDPAKYGLPKVSLHPINGGYEIIGLNDKMNREIRYIPADYPLPQKQCLNDFNPNMSLGFEQIIFLWRADWAQGTRRRSGLRREGLEDKMPAEKIIYS